MRILGDRVHPQTGVPMTYVACELISGDAIVGDAEEIAAVAWIEHGDIPEYVPYGLFEPVQKYLDEALPADHPHAKAPPGSSAGASSCLSTRRQPSCVVSGCDRARCR